MKGIVFGAAVLLLIVLLFGSAAAQAEIPVIDHEDITGALTADELAQAGDTEFAYTDRSVGWFMWEYLRRCMVDPATLFRGRLPSFCTRYGAAPLGVLDTSHWRFVEADDARSATAALAEDEFGGWATSYLAMVGDGPEKVLDPVLYRWPGKWMCFTTSLPQTPKPELAAYNARLREVAGALGCDVLVDVAAIESHRPDGSLCEVGGVPVTCREYVNPSEVIGAHPAGPGLRRLAEGLVRGVLAR